MCFRGIGRGFRGLIKTTDSHSLLFLSTIWLFQWTGVAQSVYCLESGGSTVVCISAELQSKSCDLRTVKGPISEREVQNVGIVVRTRHRLFDHDTGLAYRAFPSSRNIC